jgi:hypothetical protein
MTEYWRLCVRSGSSLGQCCGSGAVSRGAEIKLPLGAGGEITIAAPAPDPAPFYLSKIEEI